MSNFDTIAILKGPGTGRDQINALTLTSTTETVFVKGTDTVGTTVAAVLVLPTGVPSGSNLVGSGSAMDYNQNPAYSFQSYGRKTMIGVGTEAPYFSSTTFDVGRPFRVRVAGNATLNAGAGNTAAINLYVGTSTTTGSDTKIAALTAGGAPSTSFNFVLETVVQWDATSQVLGGWYTGQCANTLTAAHALSNAASVTTAGNLQFVVSGTFGNAGGGTINIAEFSAEQV